VSLRKYLQGKSLAESPEDQRPQPFLPPEGQKKELRTNAEQEKKY
jgi:hypothetical protein